MYTHDIIDNRSEKLVDHILTILPKTDCARFAVGYLFLSGLEALRRGIFEKGQSFRVVGH